MEKPFEHAVIIGCGLLGASLGMAMRKRGLAKVITGVGRKGSSSVAIAQARGAIDGANEDASAAVRHADLVVLCTPVRQFPEMFAQIAGSLEAGTVLTDVGSTKGEVMKWAAELLPGHAQFIGSHPMAGSEKSGPEAARDDLYHNAVCLICRGKGSEMAHQQVVGLWKAIGMRIIECDAAQHDQWVAAVSHLPHAVATTLVNTATSDPAALEAAAGGFVDTSRIASGDVTMWTDILMTNRQAVAAMLGKYERELERLRDAVERGDEDAIRRFLTQAKSGRDGFMARRNK